MTQAVKIVVDLTWEGHHTECCTEEDYCVADIVEVEVLNGPGAQHYEQDDEHQAVKAVVEVVQAGVLHLHEADGGQGGRQHHEQRHGGGDGGVLDPENVAAEQELQLAVLEPVPVEQSGEDHLPVVGHRLHTVVHGESRAGTDKCGGAENSHSQISNFLSSTSSESSSIVCFNL